MIHHSQFRVPRPSQLVRCDRSPLRSYPLTHPGVFKKPLDFSSPRDNIVPVYVCIYTSQSLPFQTHETITPQSEPKAPKNCSQQCQQCKQRKQCQQCTPRSTCRIHHMRMYSPATPRYWQNPLPVDQLLPPQGFYCLRRCFSDALSRTVRSIHQTPCRSST